MKNKKKPAMQQPVSIPEKKAHPVYQSESSVTIMCSVGVSEDFSY